MVEEIERNFEIFVITNRYKDIFDDFIDSLDIKSPSILSSINKRLYNITLDFEDKLIKTRFKFYDNISDKSKWQK